MFDVFVDHMFFSTFLRPAEESIYINYIEINILKILINLFLRFATGFIALISAFINRELYLLIDICIGVPLEDEIGIWRHAIEFLEGDLEIVKSYHFKLVFTFLK